MTASHWIATFFMVGHMRPAPGSWGALAALPVAWALLELGGVPLFAAALLAACLLGVWATERETRGKADHDPSEIVIDEVVGQWVALLPVALGAEVAGVSYLTLWPGWVAAFVLFRLFDIWKPGPIGWADRQPGALGVMLDDVLAGLLAALGVVALAALAHGVMGA